MKNKLFCSRLDAVKPTDAAEIVFVISHNSDLESRIRFMIMFYMWKWSKNWTNSCNLAQIWNRVFVVFFWWLREITNDMILNVLKSATKCIIFCEKVWRAPAKDTVCGISSTKLVRNFDFIQQIWCIIIITWRHK